jgi:hypothetical protein
MGDALFDTERAPDGVSTSSLRLERRAQEARVARMGAAKSTLDSDANVVADEVTREPYTEKELDDLVAAVEQELARVFEEELGDPKGRPAVVEGARARGRWNIARKALPPEISKLLGAVDLPALRMEVLENVENDMFGWSDRASDHGRLDQAAVRRAWRQRLWGPQRGATMKTLRHAVDNIKGVAQIQLLQEHQPVSNLPRWQIDPKIVEGILHIRDVSRGTPTFGVRSYPEATPIEVVVHVVRKWMQRTGRQHPRTWDPTAGSGTVHDVVTAIFGGTCAGTDIAIDNGITMYGDIDDVGAHPLHTQHRGVPGVFEVPAVRVTTPDLVFIHPSSRGWPGCSWLYGYRNREEVNFNLNLDLAYTLDRGAHIERIAKVVRTSVRRLAPGGLISLLIPEYVRFHQELAPDRGIATDLLRTLSAEALLIERHEVVDDHPVRQTSLDRARSPLVHLILARPGPPR